MYDEAVMRGKRVKFVRLMQQCTHLHKVLSAAVSPLPPGFQDVHSQNFTLFLLRLSHYMLPCKNIALRIYAAYHTLGHTQLKHNYPVHCLKFNHVVQQ